MKTKITLKQLEKQHTSKNYQEFYDYILKEIENGRLIPIKNSKLNGKKPALFNTYWKPENVEKDEDLKNELLYHLDPRLNPDYYLKSLDKYKEDRKEVLQLTHYLEQKKIYFENHSKEEPNKFLAISMNERSFEIFGREKYLSTSGGKTLLNRLGVETELLSYYETSVPMSYYTVHKRTPQNFVIIENNDTFYSMRKYLIEHEEPILGLEIGTLVYGAGKGIFKSFFDYTSRVEAYFGHEDNQVLYFGDLDYEGIQIYEKFAKACQENHGIIVMPWTKAYEKMIRKAELFGEDNLPDTKTGQKEADCTYFLQFFEEDIREAILRILSKRRYVPQEIINRNDY